jgi:Flp pilus assembly protein TadG
MSQPSIRLTRHTNLPGQRGTVAWEFALILPILLGIIFTSIFFGKVFMYKSAQSAAFYLASMPRSAMANAQQAEANVSVAQWIADDMMSDIKQGNQGNAGVQIQCDGRLCGMGVPREITVVASVFLIDEYFGDWTRHLTDGEPINLDARITMPYAGK